MKYITLVVALLSVGCFSLDDFSYQEINDPNAPIPCMVNEDCPRLNGAIQICENRYCRTPIGVPSVGSISGPIYTPVEIPINGGTYYAGDIRILPEDGGTFIIEADDIIIGGTVVADPSKATTVGFLARQSLWVRQTASFRSQDSSVQARFILQSQGKLFIDDEELVSQGPACVCYRGEGGNERSNDEVLVTGSSCDRAFQCFSIE